MSSSRKAVSSGENVLRKVSSHQIVHRRPPQLVLQHFSSQSSCVESEWWEDRTPQMKIKPFCREFTQQNRSWPEFQMEKEVFFTLRLILFWNIAGEFTQENQQKIKHEEEKDQMKIDPWKVWSNKMLNVLFPVWNHSFVPFRHFWAHLVCPCVTTSFFLFQIKHFEPVWGKK